MQKWNRKHRGSVLLLLFLVGCSVDSAEPALSVVRDSAGIEIVENLDRSNALATWTMSPEPSLSIGAVDGRAEYLLTRVTEVIRLDDGRIIVADGGANTIRFYDADGAYLMAVGQPGDGPGEFRGISAMATVNDSLFVTDYAIGRMSSFGLDGGVGGAVQLRGPDGNRYSNYVDVIGVVEDGFLLIPAGGASGVPGPTALTWVDVGQGYVFDRSGVGRRALGEPVGGDAFVSPLFGTTAPFGRFTFSAVRDGQLHMFDGGQFEIRTYDVDDSEFTRIVRVSRAATPVTQEMIEQYTQDRLEGRPAEAQARIRERDALLLFPENLPVIQLFHVDDAGFLWVSDYKLPWDRDQGERMWNVLDPQGRLSARLAAPANFRIQQIGSDFLLGVWTDENGVQFVRMYDLNRT